MKNLLMIFTFIIITFSLACGGGSGDDDGSIATGRIMAIAEKEGDNETIKVGGGPGSVPPGSTVTVTKLNTTESKSTVALGDGSFDPEFTGSTDDMFRVEVNHNGELVEEMTIGVTLLTDIVDTNIGTLGDTPTALEIRDGIAYVANGFSDNIQRFNLDQTPPAEMSSVPVPVGSDPVAIDILDNNTAYTANMIGQSVALVNLQTGGCELLYARQAPENDTGCDEVFILQDAFEDPSDVELVGSKLYVTNNNFDEFFLPIDNGFVTVINTETHQVSSIVESDGANSGNITLLGDEILILNTGNFIFDSGTGEFECDDQFPPSLTFIDSNTDTVSDTIHIPLSVQDQLVCAPGTMAISPDENFAYLGLSLVGGMLKLDIVNKTVVNGTSNPIAFTDLSGLNFVSDIGFNEQGLGFVSLFNSDQIAVFNPENDELNPFPFSSPIPAGIKAVNPESEFFDGVQSIDFRNDDPAGPGLYFITGLSSMLGSVDTELLTQ